MKANNDKSVLQETIPIDSDSETSEIRLQPLAVQSPFSHFLVSLEDLSFQHPINKSHSAPFGRLQMFPPVDEEMTWDNSTTPPALRKLTDEEVHEELTSAVAESKLFDTEDDFVDIEELTSQDSDDVFFDESILEVSINGRKRFSRENPLRRKLGIQEFDKKEVTEMRMLMMNSK